MQIVNLKKTRYVKHKRKYPKIIKLLSVKKMFYFFLANDWRTVHNDAVVVDDDVAVDYKTRMVCFP
jgi:hypothetical protein